MSIHYPCMWAQSVVRIAVGPSILIELRLASRRYVHSLDVHVWCFWRDTQYYIDRQTTSWNRGPVCFKKGFFLRQNLFFRYAVMSRSRYCHTVWFIRIIKTPILCHRRMDIEVFLRRNLSEFNYTRRISTKMQYGGYALHSAYTACARCPNILLSTTIIILFVRTCYLDPLPGAPLKAPVTGALSHALDWPPFPLVAY